MARSLSSVARTLVSLSESAGLALNKRGYAATSSSSVRPSEEMRKNAIEGLVDSPSSSWVPDPVTGYYRPANRAAEVDAAELRNMMWSTSSRKY